MVLSERRTDPNRERLGGDKKTMQLLQEADETLREVRDLVDQPSQPSSERMGYSTGGGNLKGRQGQGRKHGFNSYFPKGVDRKLWS